MAFFDTTWYVNFGDGATTGYYAVAKRPQNAAVAAGQLVRQFTAPAVGSERCWICTIAGTTANTTDATWTLGRASTTSDGTATWREITGTSAINGDLANTPTWAQVKAGGISIGNIIKRSNNVSYQMCTGAGTMGASEPAFSDTAGVTTSDATSTWTCLGPVSNFTGGQAPHARLANALATTWFASGNTVYVGDNHAETQGTNMNLAPSSALMAKILCHNHSGSYPPAASDITTGATITATGGANLQFTGQGSFYFYGITFVLAAASAIGAGAVGQTQNWYYFDNCSWQLTGSTTLAIGGSSTSWGIIVFNNTTVKFGAIGGTLGPYFCNFVWQNTGQILVSGSSIPTALFTVSAAGRFANVTLNNLDLSQLTGSLFTNASFSSIGTLIVQDCKLNASMTVTSPINTGMNVQLIRSDSAGTSYKSTRYAYEGTETTETSIVRTGGAVDPMGQAQSRKIATSANAQWLRPYKAEPMVIWNSVTGTNRVVTVYGTVNAGALPNNDDIWLEVEYLADSGSPLGKIVTTTKSSVLASNAAVSSDGSVWATVSTVLDTVSNAVLSNGGLTVTRGSTAVGGARGSVFPSLGKFYFEAKLITSRTAGNGIGIITSAGAVNASITAAACVGLSLGASATTLWVNAVNTISTVVTPAINDVYGFAIDFTNQLIWYRVNGGIWNNNAGANPATGTLGAVFAANGYAPFVSFASSGSITDAVTVNFGSTAFANAAPSGFLNWDAAWTPFKLTTTLFAPQPQLAGYLHARVRAAKASTTFYIDPKVELT